MRNLSHKKPSHRQLAAEKLRQASFLDPVEVFLDPRPARSAGRPQLLSLPLPVGIDSAPIPADVSALIDQAQARIQRFQDRWDQPQIEQFVASDFELVYRVLRWIVEQQLMTGQRMLEWGCGFAVVAALGSRLGLDVTGIEAEQRLLEEAKTTIKDFAAPVECVWGNFLPPGAESLSHDPDFPSLGHQVPCGYKQIGSDLDDFALVFGYPWPGEWTFHEAVFARYGAPGALMVLFYGPNDVRVWRKVH
jgi:hypothetical protein